MRYLTLIAVACVVVGVGGCRRRASHAGSVEAAAANVTGQSIFAAAISEGQARAAILRALTDKGFTPTVDAAQHIEGVWTRRGQQIWARVNYTATGCAVSLDYTEPERQTLSQRRMNDLLSAVATRIEEESRRGIVVTPNAPSVQATVTVTPAPPSNQTPIFVQGTVAQ